MTEPKIRGPLPFSLSFKMTGPSAVPVNELSGALLEGAVKVIGFGVDVSGTTVKGDTCPVLAIAIRGAEMVPAWKTAGSTWLADSIRLGAGVDGPWSGMLDSKGCPQPEISPVHRQGIMDRMVHRIRVGFLIDDLQTGSAGVRTARYAMFLDVIRIGIWRSRLQMSLSVAAIAAAALGRNPPARAHFPHASSSLR
ncbi:hypothetical protein EP7_005305 [Isosphaeraceae bacterium EP7]